MNGDWEIKVTSDVPVGPSTKVRRGPQRELEIGQEERRTRGRQYKKRI